MPSFVQVSAPASQDTQTFVGNPSSAGTAGSGESVFSAHLEAQQQAGENEVRDTETDSVTEKTDSSGANETSVDSEAKVEGGNKSPLEDEDVPQQQRALEANAVAVFHEEALQGDGLARTFSNKQYADRGKILDGDVDSDLAINLGKARKIAVHENASPKLPVAIQIGNEALSSDFGAKENFELVRQNIIELVAGKSVVPGSTTLAAHSMSYEKGDAPLQGLSFSNASSPPLGTELAKSTSALETTASRFFTLQTPAGHPGWDVEVGNRIRWMIGQNNSGVELRLNPPELGSIEVKVSTEGERTNITFFSTNPAARDVLEAALPRLREMFAENGMELANADVSERSFEQEQERLSSAEGFSADRDDGEVAAIDIDSVLASSHGGRGAIDYYI